MLRRVMARFLDILHKMTEPFTTVTFSARVPTASPLVGVPETLDQYEAQLDSSLGFVQPRKRARITDEEATMMGWLTAEDSKQ